MLISEAIAKLQDLLDRCGDMELMISTDTPGMYVSPRSFGWTVMVALMHPIFKTLTWWRRPFNDKDEPEKERVRKAVILL